MTKGTDEHHQRRFIPESPQLHLPRPDLDTMGKLATIEVPLQKVEGSRLNYLPTADNFANWELAKPMLNLPGPWQVVTAGVISPPIGDDDPRGAAGEQFGGDASETANMASLDGRWLFVCVLVNKESRAIGLALEAANSLEHCLTFYLPGRDGPWKQVEVPDDVGKTMGVTRVLLVALQKAVTAKVDGEPPS